MTQDAATPNSSNNNAIDADLLSLLRCPLTRSKLTLEGDYLVAQVGGLAYPIRNGIPVMLVEEARLPAGITSLDQFRERFKNEIPAR